ncbi:hypothetical protein [Williamsia herbipolensis]|uniref:hypothetical protein n=1 Tax=Williamsia herbipolensis TaxID=1603258 RepID=UPI0005F896A6|nr:hypothetical protein [Williamsia herbipolensis]
MSELDSTNPVPAPLAEQAQPNTDPANTETPEIDPAANDHTDERKLRRRAQAAEAERDTLAARLKGLQLAEVERQLAVVLAVPGDLFDFSDTTLADLCDPDTGAVDPEKVTEAASALVELRPGLAYVAPRPASRAGTYQNAGQGRGYSDRPSPVGWDQVFG